MNTASTANKERLQPISRDLEKALTAFIACVDGLSDRIDEFPRDTDNVIYLDNVFDERPECDALTKILDKYITHNGEYIGPRNFAVTYKGEAVLCKISAGELDGFMWLSGVLRIFYDFGFTTGAGASLKFGQ